MRGGMTRGELDHNRRQQIDVPPHSRPHLYGSTWRISACATTRLLYFPRPPVVVVHPGYRKACAAISTATRPANDGCPFPNAVPGPARSREGEEGAALNCDGRESPNHINPFFPLRFPTGFARPNSTLAAYRRGADSRSRSLTRDREGKETVEETPHRGHVWRLFMSSPCAAVGPLARTRLRTGQGQFPAITHWLARPLEGGKEVLLGPRQTIKAAVALSALRPVLQGTTCRRPGLGTIFTLFPGHAEI